MLVPETTLPNWKKNSNKKDKRKLGIITEKSIPLIICFVETGWTKYNSKTFDLITLRYVVPADLIVNKAKNIINTVPYPSLDPSGNNFGLSITNADNFTKINKKTKDKINIIVVDAKRSLTE